MLKSTYPIRAIVILFISLFINKVEAQWSQVSLPDVQSIA